MLGNFRPRWSLPFLCSPLNCHHSRFQVPLVWEYGGLDSHPCSINRGFDRFRLALLEINFLGVVPETELSGRNSLGASVLWGWIS